MKSKKILSLICCVLMMCAAAICVNKGLFGHNFNQQDKLVNTPGDTITVNQGGNVVVHTKYLTDVAGYAGVVPLDIYISDEGIITDIKPLPNDETPDFFNSATYLFTNWIGKNAKDISPMKADAISGATYSSNAIKENMTAGVKYYLKDSYKTKEEQSVPFKMWVAVVVSLAACILPLLVKNKIYLMIQLVANVIVLGFWCGQFLDYALMLKYLSSGISLPVGLVAVIMLIAAFIFPLFGRPQHYCNHICPLGSAQILLGKIFKYKVKMSVRTVKYLDWFRKILWAVLMLLLWTDVMTEWLDLELFQAFMIQVAPIGIIVTAGVFLLISLIISRPYCRFVCPTGSLFKRAENIG